MKAEILHALLLSNTTAMWERNLNNVIIVSKEGSFSSLNFSFLFYVFE